MCNNRQTSGAKHDQTSGAKHGQTSRHGFATARTFRQIMKPILPRKTISFARINLNHYWNVLEDLVSAPAMIRPANNNQMDMSSEINENLANERKEIQDLSVTHEEDMDDA